MPFLTQMALKCITETIAITLLNWFVHSFIATLKSFLHQGYHAICIEKVWDTT